MGDNLEGCRSLISPIVMLDEIVVPTDYRGTNNDKVCGGVEVEVER